MNGVLAHQVFVWQKDVHSIKSIGTIHNYYYCSKKNKKSHNNNQTRANTQTLMENTIYCVPWTILIETVTCYSSGRFKMLNEMSHKMHSTFLNLR